MKILMKKIQKYLKLLKYIKQLQIQHMHHVVLVVFESLLTYFIIHRLSYIIHIPAVDVLRS